MIHKIRWITVFSICMAAYGQGTALGSDQTTVDIGSRLELFTDRLLIDRMDETRLQLHPPVSKGTALKFDKPWEGRYCGYVTVIEDNGIYRLYYRGLPVSKSDGSNAEVTCCAESRDGITWTKPNLGIFEVNGTRENNVILKDVAPFSHNFAPFLDTKPGVSRSQRYKAMAGTGKSGLAGYVSEDGLRWKKIREKPLITKGAFDSQNVAFWSEIEQCYVCYFRTWTKGEYKGYRTVSRTTSTNFLDWTDPVEMTFGDTPYEHLYTNQTRPYYRAPHLYIALAARFMPGRRVLSQEQFVKLGGEASYSGDCSDTVLMTSRGGNRYDRAFMEGFVRPGMGLEHWSSRTNYPTCGVIPTGRNTMSLFVQRRYGQLSHYLERFSLRVDGFVSVNAGYAVGEMVTKPLRFSGNRLILNYSTSAAGGIRVEIQDRDGKPVPGFTLKDADEAIGDWIERTVTWKGRSDVSKLKGKPVRLRFVMKDADLYSLKFSSQAGEI